MPTMNHVGAALDVMKGKTSLHEGQGQFDNLQQQDSETGARAFASKLLNSSLANIRIDDSLLEKNLAMILDRLSAVEVRP